MIKKLLSTIALVALAFTSYGQGTVNFNTRVLNPDGSGTLVVDRRVQLLDGSYPTNNFLAQLYAASGTGAAENSLVAVGVPVAFRGGNFAGYISGGAVTVTPTAGGAATVQIRSWSNTFASYEAALASSAGIYGKGALISLASTGGGGNPPGLPVDLLGSDQFTLVPEPSTLVLGALGLAGFLFRRRN